MLIAELWVESDCLQIPGLSELKGKKVEVQIIESESPADRERRLAPFFNLAGTIEIDIEAVDELRSESIL